MAYPLRMPSSPPIGPNDCGDQELISLESAHFTVWAVLVVRIGEGNGNPLQYPCLENPMDREEPGSGVRMSQTSLTMHAHRYVHEKKIKHF